MRTQSLDITNDLYRVSITWRSPIVNVLIFQPANKNIDWPTTFCGTLANLYIDVAIDNSEKCTMFVPQNRAIKVRFPGFTMKERSL